MLLLLQKLFQKIQLTYSSLTIEQEYKKFRKIHLKGFFRIVVSVICFVSVSLIITNSLDENYWTIIPPSIWLLVCSILWIFYNKLEKLMDYLLFILYLTYCGICLFLLRDPSLPTISNVYFYQGYSYGIFEKIVTVRLPYFSFRIILSLMSFGLRMYLYPVHDTFPLILQVLMFVFSLATDYWHEKEGRSVFQDCYNYREELTKFQTLIASNLPAKILILSADLKEILFKNEGLLRTIKKFAPQAKNTTDLQLLTNWLEQLKVDTDNLNEETKHVIASQEGKAKNDNLFNLLKIIQSSQNLISKDQQKFRLHAEHHSKFTNTKKVFETIVFPLTWDSKNAIALILNDITQNYQNLTLKVADVNKNKMLAMISHELKTPLNGILGVVNILKKEISESHLLQYLSICKNSGELLLNLVNSILDLQHIRDNKFVLKPSKDDLHQLLMDTYDLFKFQFDQKNLSLELKIDTQVPEVIVTDQNRLRQILINLIGNALKFTFRGGAAIAVSLDPNQKGYVHFKVSDSGIGIKDSDKKKLFKMYGRLDQPDPSVNTQGTGFGLEISDQLARLLSGDMESGGIKVESKEGTGTTFSFSIKDNYDHEHDNDSCYDSEMKYYEPGIFEEDIEDLSVKMSPYSSPSYAIYSEKTLIPRNSKLHDLNFRFISESEAVKSLKSESFEMSIGNEYFPQRRQNSKQAKTQVPSLYGRGLSLDQRILKSHLTSFERRNSQKSRESVSAALLRHRSSIIAGKLRILLVDDNTFNLLIAKNLLENLNYGVDTALNGKLAIEEVLKAQSLEDFKLCAILMDIQMPVMDGYEATKKLKQMMKQKEIPEIPIIAVSANDSEDDKKRSLEVGMHSHLSKPLNETMLRETLEEVLGSKILSDEMTGGNQTCEEDNMESPKKGILTGLRKKTSIMMEKRIIKHSGESLEV